MHYYLFYAIVLSTLFVKIILGATLSTSGVGNLFCYQTDIFKMPYYDLFNQPFMGYTIPPTARTKHYYQRTYLPSCIYLSFKH